MPYPQIPQMPTPAPVPAAGSSFLAGMGMKLIVVAVIVAIGSTGFIAYNQGWVGSGTPGEVQIGDSSSKIIDTSRTVCREDFNNLIKWDKDIINTAGAVIETTDGNLHIWSLIKGYITSKSMEKCVSDDYTVKFKFRVVGDKANMFALAENKDINIRMNYYDAQSLSGEISQPTVTVNCVEHIDINVYDEVIPIGISETIATLEPDTWYELRTEVRPFEKSYEVYINDEFKRNCYIYDSPITSSEFIIGDYYARTDYTGGAIRLGEIYMDYFEVSTSTPSSKIAQDIYGWVIGSSAYSSKLTGIILHTKNSGTTWTSQEVGIEDIGLRGGHFINKDIGWVVGSDGIILKTINSGTTWSVQPKINGMVEGLTAVYFINENIGWIKTGEFNFETRKYKSWQTIDGGQNWREINLQVESIDFINEKEGWALRDGNLVHTTDSGLTWNTLSTSNQLVEIEFVNNKKGWAIIKDDHFLIGTSDGGKNWKELYVAADLGNHLEFVNENVGWISLRQTKDGGQTWDEINNPEIRFINEPFGSDSQYYHSTDFKIYNLEFVNENQGWASNTDGLWYTKDGGHTWVQQYKGYIDKSTPDLISSAALTIKDFEFQV